MERVGGAALPARLRGAAGAPRRPHRPRPGRAAAQAARALHLRRPRSLVHLERAAPSGTAPGGMRICRAEVFLVRLPLRLTVRHALAARRESLNLVVRLCDDQGNEGWGEGVPRDYVTGESAETSFEHLADGAPAVARSAPSSRARTRCLPSVDEAPLALAGEPDLLLRRRARPVRPRRQGVQPIGGVVVRRAAAGVGPVLGGPPAAGSRRDDRVPARRAAPRRVAISRSRPRERSVAGGPRRGPRGCWGTP